MLTRREFQTAGLLAAGALSIPGRASAAAADGTGGEHVPDAGLPRDPASSVRQFMRLFAGLRGEVCISCEGIVYGHAAGALPERLVGFRSALIIRSSEPRPGVFRTEQREAMHYADLVTGEPLQSFKSPYNGETLLPIGYVSPLNVYFFDVQGSYMQRPTDAPERGPSFDWRSDNADVWVTESRFNTFPAAFTEAEFPRAFAGAERKSVDILTYRASRRDFSDDGLASLPAYLTLQSFAPWPYWLMRGRAPGGVIWQGYGRKYPNFASMPRRFRETTESAFPGFLRDPWRFPEWEFGTAAQMRRLRAAGKI